MNFQSVKLGKLCKIQSGGTPRRGVEGFYGGSIPWAKIGDIENAQNGYIRKTVETITPAGLISINNKIFPKNTVFLAMYGSVGKTSIAGLEMTTNQAILGLQPNNQEVLHFRYLKYWLDYSKKDLIKKARGVALQNISATIVKEFEIPLPPLEDQKRIVKILDQADALRQKRKQAIGLLDDYLQSIYLEMFGDGKDLEIVKLESLAENSKGSMRTGPFGSDLRHSEFVSDGIAVIGIDNAAKNKFEWAQRRYITPEKYQKLKRYTVFPRDVIITIMATIGRSAVVPDDIPIAINTKHLATITLDQSKANPYFIAYSIHSDQRVRKQILGNNRGAIMPGLNLGIIKNLNIVKFPVEVQNKFEMIYKNIEVLKERMFTQSHELDVQFQALMQKAFKGEL